MDPLFRKFTVRDSGERPFNFIFVTSASLSLFFSAEVDTSADWTYDRDSNRGPKHWPKLFPSCAARHQSPINIDTNHITFNAGLTAFNWSNYASIPRDASWLLTNSGKTIKIYLDGHYVLEDGGLEAPYKAEFCLFHWGSDSKSGSEHTVDGESYPAELQIVHYRADMGSYEEAVLHPNGILALSFLFKLGLNENPTLGHIIKQLVQIPYPGDSVHVRPLPFLSLLPINLNDYYQYEGTMSHPPCHQNVMWVVFHDHIDMSPNQLKALQSSVFTSPRRTVPPVLMRDSHRPIQPHAGRPVYSSYSGHASIISTSVASPIGITLAVLLGFIIMFVVLNRVYGINPPCCTESDTHLD